MKIVVTGSLGNISKPLTQQLVKNGHTVTVVSSSAERKNEIESIGAKPAIGKMQDVAFLTSTFKRCGPGLPDGEPWPQLFFRS